MNSLKLKWNFGYFLYPNNKKRKTSTVRILSQYENSFTFISNIFQIFQVFPTQQYIIQTNDSLEF